MGGIRYKLNGSDIPLIGLQIANSDGYFHKPDMTVKDIEDVSKKDLFAKVIAALQFLQLVLSLIVRTVQGMAFSQLETLTVGFAICGFFTYLLYWYKPQGVEVSFPIGMQHIDNDQGRRDYAIPSVKTFDSFWDVLINKKKMTQTSTPVTRIPNDNIPVSQNQWGHPGLFLLALASALFGAIHAIAWDFEFPSAQEKMLWHVATVIAVASPVVGLFLVPVTQWTFPSDGHAFIRDALRLLREYSWHTRDKAAVNRIYTRLQSIYTMRNANSREAQLPFIYIFFEPDQGLRLPDQLLDFLNARGNGKRQTASGS
ncbi:hypothetical protein PG990_012203 [Apiospora arundinis]